MVGLSEAFSSLSGVEKPSDISVRYPVSEYSNNLDQTEEDDNDEECLDASIWGN